ncbi:hypothetical protein [Wenzhouxiangella marina]|uniref:Uncharacterized protein n=1 Tax=Wenzhouxiangella marina TaxID=1579979 RepID=A0A0K0Y0E2_9GAMM|nr:hypothetical protein [Wenzhouxiangella marina]AKS43390.1 hypothetical protein WM2015_3038 [Wenzhouxiangella marina]MBB6088494.1 hypothetical protein [Wenzhouxiangella marina]
MLLPAAYIIIFLAALFLIALSQLCFIAPDLSARFLGGFAQTLPRHLLEMSLRMLVGLALVLAAPDLAWPLAMGLFGWVLIATSMVLLILPWRWHRAFAERVLPPLIDRVWLFGLLSLPLGVVMLMSQVLAS